MAISVKPLTPTQVDKAKPKNKDYVLSDGQGLRCIVRPNGTKRWVLNYQNPITGKRTNFRLGLYPATSLADARLLRKKYLEYLAKGLDPQEQLLKQQNHDADEKSKTFGSVALQWFQKKSPSVTQEHATDMWRSLELHVLPSLSDIPISDLTPKLIVQTLEPIEAKGNYETLRRLCQRINEIMVFGVNLGLIPFNQLANIKAVFTAPQKQHMPTISPSQLGELVNRIYNASLSVTTRNLLMWQLHTMTRPSEAAGTRWDEIDFEEKVWVIPASRMKKRVEHRIPLSDESLKILQRMKPISQNSLYVFSSPRCLAKSLNSQTANMALKRMGYEGQLVAHGLRALASTTLNEQGFSPDLIESALAHLDKNEIRRAYNRTDYFERRRTMMSWWSAHILGNLQLI
ncbi:TPA: integrase domain-containing protein [Photobacterium damselae]